MTLAERASLLALGALFCLPFLVPVHLPPIGGFYAEWLAAALGLAAVAVLFGKGRLISLPHIALLPLALVAALLLQLPGDRLAYAETGLIAMLYLLWALLLMAVAATLRARIDAIRIVEQLACWTLAGALANALVAFLAHGGVESAWIMPRISGAIAYGNLAQRNHFAEQLWLGMASLLFLAGRGRIRPPALVTGALVLACAAVLSGSRATLLYAPWLLLASLRWRGSLNPRHAAVIIAVFVLAQITVPFWPGVDPATLPGSRALAEFDALLHRKENDYGSGEGARLTLIFIAGEMVERAPWLGTGFGSFARESFATADRLEGRPGAAEHAHNLIAQLLGEFGLPLALLVVFLLGRWCWQLLRRPHDPAAGWLAGMAGVTLLHAMLEYPLWYAFFLGPFAVVLALGDERQRTIVPRRALLALIVAAGIFVGGSLLYDYVRLQAWNSLKLLRQANPEFMRQRNTALLELRQGSLLKPWIDASFAAMVAPTRARLADKLVLCRLTLRHAPESPAVFACALLHDLAGRHEEAQHLWRLARAAFPDDAATYRKELAELLDRDDLQALEAFFQAEVQDQRSR